MIRKHQIARAFGRAAQSYDAAAHIQRDGAALLAADIARLDLPDRVPILEIGCGTGFLSRLLCHAYPGHPITLTDLAPEMLAACRARLGAAPERDFRIMDGEAPDLAGPYGLIASNLTFQWFADPVAAAKRLAGLLAPGGHLLFTTLGAGTFAEWHAAHLAARRPSPVAAYPRAADLPGRVHDHVLHEIHPNALAFLRALKAIGAQHPRNGHTPAPPGGLRAALRRLEADSAAEGGVRITYHLLCCHVTTEDL